MSASTIITLANGRGIDLLNPMPSDIDWAAFAEQLAKENRYNGATPGTEYSVAEHTVRGVNEILKTGDRELAAYFALHDAHEAVLKDDPTPKKKAIAEIAEQNFGVLGKQVMQAFRDLTDRLDAVIHEAAGCVWPPPGPVRVQVKRWDLIMFVTEWRDLMKDVPHPNWAPYSGILPLEQKIRPWAPGFAEMALRQRWSELLPRLQGGRKIAVLRAFQ
jgi:hypothetical protein